MAHVHVIDRQFYHGGDIGQRVTDGQFDLPRAKEGGVDAMFFSMFVTEDYYPQRLETKQTLRLMDLALTQLENNRDKIELAQNASDIERINKAGKIAAVLDLEGGFDLDGDLGVLRDLVSSGLRSAAAFGAQLGQQLRGFLLLAAEIARPERSRPRGRPRDEPARDGDQRVARVGRDDRADGGVQQRAGGGDASRDAHAQQHSAKHAGRSDAQDRGEGRSHRVPDRQRVPQREGVRLANAACRQAILGYERDCGRAKASSASRRSTARWRRSFLWSA